MPPPRVPKQIVIAGIRFRIAGPWRDGRVGADYKDGGKRVQIKRASIEELRAELETVAASITNAETAARTLNAEDRRIYIAARDALTPFSLPVDAAARLLAETLQHVPPHQLIEAARQFANSSQAASTAKTPAVVAHYLRSLRADSLSAQYLDRLEADLTKFASAFPATFSAITPAELSDWIFTLPVGPRRRRKIRDQIVALSNFARDHEYLPLDRRTAAERVKRPVVKRKAPAIYSPEEFDLLLLQCAQPRELRSKRRDYTDFIPALCIGAFAGLRWSEIQGLEWQHIHWDDKVIEVGEEHKTGYRLVEIQPNLLTWLSHFRGRHGKICLQKRPDLAIRRIRQRAGLPEGGRRYANALRHSYATYRVAITKNFATVAAETGHSVAELKKSYNRASLERVAKAWFSIQRDAQNVLQMPLFSLKG